MKFWMVMGAATIGCLGSSGASVAQASVAQPSVPARWFTVTGNPVDAAVDTVQVDPVARRIEGPLKTMSVRVSRGMMRHNWEGVAYRSYESEVAFDCRARRADYRTATFYSEPLWQGPAHITTDYTQDPKPMLFRDMSPNPTLRLVRAACRLHG